MSFSSADRDANEHDAAKTTALYGALGSLDVQLEAELERYRTVRGQQGDRDALKRPAVIPEATIAQTAMPPQKITSAVGELATPDAETASSTPKFDGTNSPFDLNAGESAGNAVTAANREDSANGDAQEGNAGDVNLEFSEAAIAPPDSYLASSEALLASNRSRRRAARQISPLGVGGICLLLLGSLTVGYVLVNPESLDRLGWRDWFQSDADQATNTPSGSGDSDDSGNPANIEAATGSEQAELPTSPNLATEEFVDIQLDTLSELDPPATPTPTPAPTPAPAPDANSIDNLANALAPQTTSNPAPSPDSNSAPSPSPAPALANVTPPLPAVIDDPSYTGLYLVVVNEGNPTALSQVQTTYPEAYFEEIVGARRIQVGAFDDLQLAQKVASRLTGQGLPAQVYRP